MVFDSNFFSILAAAVAAVVIGAVWYAPPVFGAIWMKLAGIDANDKSAKKRMPLMIFVAFIAAVVFAWVLSFFSFIWGATTLGSALELGFWMWLGFMVPALLGPVLWEGRSVKYFAITAGYWFVVALVTASIVSLWS